MGENVASERRIPGYVMTWLGACFGCVAGGFVGVWLGTIAEGDEGFGAYPLLVGTFGVFVGGAVGVWLLLRLIDAPVPDPTALMFVIVSIPAAIIFGVLGAWFGPEDFFLDAHLGWPRSQDVVGVVLLVSWLTTSALLARWISVANEDRDPFA